MGSWIVPAFCSGSAPRRALKMGRCSKSDPIVLFIFLDTMLLSAHVERVSVSRMRDFLVPIRQTLWYAGVRKISSCLQLQCQVSVSLLTPEVASKTVGGVPAVSQLCPSQAANDQSSSCHAAVTRHWLLYCSTVLLYYCTTVLLYYCTVLLYCNTVQAVGTLLATIL